MLPNFASHEEDSKNHPIDSPITPPEYIRRFLDRQLQRLGAGPADVRVLDVGCGRGDTVGWLCSRGWDARGVDISQDYLDRGRDYLRRIGSDPARLVLANSDSSYPFADETFDIVLSDQVIEHVADLDTFVSEVARVTAPEGVGMHIFPAKWRPVETHLLTPVVHWLPKGPVRRHAIAAMLRVGAAASYFDQLPLADRVKIFSSFSDEETFYRSLAETVAVMRRHGLRCDATPASRDKIGFHLPRAPHAALPALGWVYRNFFSVVLCTEKAPPRRTAC